MKVVHVVRQFSPSIGGLEEAVLKLCQALQRRDVTVSVVTLDRVKRGATGTLAAHDSIGGIEVRRIPFRGSWRYPVAPAVFGALGDADVVHVHGIDFFFDALAAGRVFHRKPLVASTHGGFFHTAFARKLKQAYFQTVTRLSCQAYRAICASSESDLDLFRPIAGSNLTLVENGVDVAKWHDQASLEPVRSLIAIGRFSSNKNLPALIAVLQRLQGLDPSWTLCLAGQPWDVSAAELRATAQRFGVTRGLTILEAPDDVAIRDAIGRASYIVSASSYEGFGISAVEGLSAGLVPVLNTIPPFAKLIRNAACGLLVDITNVDATAASIENLHATVLCDPARQRQTAIAAASRYGWDAAAALFHRHYAAAVGGLHPIKSAASVASS